MHDILEDSHLLHKLKRYFVCWKCQPEQNFYNFHFSVDIRTTLHFKVIFHQNGSDIFTTKWSYYRLFRIINLMYNSFIFNNIYVTLLCSSTCFEQHAAHPQEDQLYHHSLWYSSVTYILLKIKELCIKLIIWKSLYYDARSEKQQIMQCRTSRTGRIISFNNFQKILI